MSRPLAHLFNPENDLALATGQNSYTPPRAAVVMKRSGATLPLWYGNPGDEVIAAGVNSQWLNAMQEAFGLETNVWRHDCRGFIPSPWGWSEAIERTFLKLGFSQETMLMDFEIHRNLSSRRSACEIGSRLARNGLMRREDVAEEIYSVGKAEEYVLNHRDCLFKLPWSSSGRGQIRVDGAENFYKHSAAIEGALRRQGFLCAEPFHRNRALDFAMLFECHGQGCLEYCGLSLFRTADNADYLGNILASEESLFDKIHTLFPAAADFLPELSACLRAILGEYLDKYYRGPLGVDMMILDDGSVIPCVEMNLRMTMGHVARRFSRNFLAPGSEGIFHIVPRKPGEAFGPADCEICNCRLVSGILDLNPAEFPLAFRVEVAPQD